MLLADSSFFPIDTNHFYQGFYFLIKDQFGNKFPPDSTLEYDMGETEGFKVDSIMGDRDSIVKIMENEYREELIEDAQEAKREQKKPIKLSSPLSPGKTIGLTLDFGLDAWAFHSGRYYISVLYIVTKPTVDEIKGEVPNLFIGVIKSNCVILEIK